MTFLNGPNAVCLSYFFVAKKYRKTDASRCILEMFFRVAKERGFQRVLIDIVEPQSGPLKGKLTSLYENYGFKSKVAREIR